MGIPQQQVQSMLRRFQMANNRYFRTGELPFTLIGINQLREKVGSYGNPEYTPGGRGKDFFATCNIRLKTGDYIKEGNKFVGQVVKYKISKNKVYKRMGTGEIDFFFAPNNAGIPPLCYDVIKDVVIVACQFNLIQRGGSWYTYKDIKTQGLDAMLDTLNQKPEYLKQIREEVFEIVKKTK